MKKRERRTGEGRKRVEEEKRKKGGKRGAKGRNAMQRMRGDEDIGGGTKEGWEVGNEQTDLPVGNEDNQQGIEWIRVEGGDREYAWGRNIWAISY